MTHAQIINRWPSLAEFAGDIGVEYGTAKAMRRRSSIPAEYWIGIVSIAAARGIDGVTLEALASAVSVLAPDLTGELVSQAGPAASQAGAGEVSAR